MNFYLLVFLAVVGGTYGLAINSNGLFQNTRNISCIFSADLLLPASIIPVSLSGILSSISSSWGLLGNISSTITTLQNIGSLWNFEGYLSTTSVFDFCFILVISNSLPDGISLPSTASAGYFGLNIFEEYIRRQCSSANFSTSVTPIGYGACDPLPYQTFTTTLCVCSTNNCNIDYATCVASVQANQSPAPANLQTMIPSVNNAISCTTSLQGSTYVNYANAYRYLTMFHILSNIYEALGYLSSSGVACVMLYNVNTGDFFNFPIIYEGYSVVSLIAPYLNKLNLFQNYAKSPTSVAIQHLSADIFSASSISNLQYFSQILCICTTDNCNLNLASCAIGFNLGQTTTTPIPTSSSTTSTGTTSSSTTSSSTTSTSTTSSSTTSSSTTSTSTISSSTTSANTSLINRTSTPTMPLGCE
jgi:hypothetical protein